MKSLINLLVVLTIFLDAVILFTGPFDFYGYYLIYAIFLLIYFLTSRKIVYNKSFIFFIALISILSLFSMVLGDLISDFHVLPFKLLIKQLVLILFSSLTYYLFIKYNDYDIDKIFRIYLRLAYFISIIGIVQFISFLINFEFGYDYSWLFNTARNQGTSFLFYRVHSIMGEPSHYAIALAPAAFVSLNVIFGKSAFQFKKKQAYLLIFSYLITFSAVAILSLAFSIFFIMKKLKFFQFKLNRRFFIIFPCLVFVSLILANVPFIALRFKDSFSLLEGKVKNVDQLNLSTYSQYSNYLVARESFLKNPLLGSGLGTHELNYDKYLKNYVNNESVWFSIKLNREDASSLFLRLLSETGIIGVGIFIWFLIKFYFSSKYINDFNYSYWLINNGILIFLLLRFVRLGNYSVMGFFLMIFMYMISFKLANVSKSQSLV
jgi:hypothetical protein